MIRLLGVVAFVTALAVVSLAEERDGEGLGAPGAEASVAEPEAVDPLVVEAERIEQSLAAHLAEGERVRARLETAEGDDADALRRHLEENGLALMRELGRFVDNVLARERAGIDTTRSRAAIDRRMRPLGKRIEEIVEEATQTVAELRSRRDEVDDADRAELEDRIAERTAWLDAAYNALAEHARGSERLGLDASEGRAFLAEHLRERVVLLGGRLRLARERVAKVEEKLEREPDDEALAAALVIEEQRLEVAKRSLRMSIELMDEIGLDTTDAKQLLIETTGEISFGLLDREVLANLARDGWDRARGMAREAAPEVTARLIRFTAVVFVFWILARVTRFAVRRAVTSSRFDISLLLQNMLMALASRSVLIVGVLLGLGQVGVEIAPLLAGLGIAGFIVGFALQDTLSNFASGAMILAYRPFDTGDVVEAGGVFGTVHDMSLVSTTMLTFDNQTLVVPNSKIWGDVITNLTSQRQRRVDLQIRVDYREDVERVAAALSEVVASHPKTLEDPPPIVQVHDLSDEGVVFIARPWARTPDYWGLRWDLLREIKKRFDREGIELAQRPRFPTPDSDAQT